MSWRARANRYALVVAVCWPRSLHLCTLRTHLAQRDLYRFISPKHTSSTRAKCFYDSLCFLKSQVARPHELRSATTRNSCWISKPREGFLSKVESKDSEHQSSGAWPLNQMRGIALESDHPNSGSRVDACASSWA